jgi:hypothetical protein
MGQVDLNGEIDKNIVEEEPRWQISAKWAAAARWALAATMSSSLQQLQEASEIGGERTIVEGTTEAIKTLQHVLQGECDEAINEALSRREVPQQRWWSVFSRAIEGLYCLTFFLSRRNAESQFQQCWVLI